MHMYLGGNRMHEIVILSGKGGTGKTSITASLAALFPKPVVVDCDVDAANMHLLLEGKRTHTETFISGKEPVVDIGACKNCGMCTENCHYNAMEIQDGLLNIDPILCEGCGLCMQICPWDAISMNSRSIGSWFQSESIIGGELFHAELNPGGEHSGKLVAEIKEKSRKFAQKNGCSLIIIDGPPGIGCPVISSLSGVDYVVLVTEPTASGLHDLKRIVELVNNFRIPMGCVINKSDIHKESFETIIHFLESEDIQLLGKIPYSEVFIHAMVQGRIVVEEKNPQGETAEIIELIHDIRDEIGRHIGEREPAMVT